MSKKNYATLQDSIMQDSTVWLRVMRFDDAAKID